MRSVMKVTGRILFFNERIIAMKMILHFIKRHKLLCAATIVLLIVDVMGGLFIPTLAARMLNLGTS